MCGSDAYRLLWRVNDSCGNSLAFPFPVLLSRERLTLVGLTRALLVLIDSKGVVDAVVPGWSGFEKSRSLPWSEVWAFCFAALTLALERIGLLSEAVTE